jgi:hypothetical protein
MRAVICPRMINFDIHDALIKSKSCLVLTIIRDNKFGLPERCYRSHWHNSLFPCYLLSCFFLSLTHFCPLVVGVNVILALDHIHWHAYTRWGCSGHGICSSQNTLPHNTHHSQATDINAPGENRNCSSRPQTHALNHATGYPCGLKILCRLQVVQIKLLLKEHPSKSQMTKAVFCCWNPHRPSASLINNAKKKSVFHVLCQAVLSLPWSNVVNARLHFYYSSNQS